MTADTRHHTYDEVLGAYASENDEGRTNQLDGVLHPEQTVDGAVGADGPLGLGEDERTARVDAIQG